ncbi:MAG: hypothetical protein R3F14_06010 [Polyangiaceae bacterium]
MTSTPPSSAARMPSFNIDLAHGENARRAPRAPLPGRVLELLDAGIDVHTTLNVAQIESLNDIAHRITPHPGASASPCLTPSPSAPTRSSSSTSLPEELILRLKEGKIHVPEHAAGSIDHLFGRGTLLALRELALRLRRRARRPGHARLPRGARHRDPPAVERILVCVGPSPTERPRPRRDPPHGREAPGRMDRRLRRAHARPTTPLPGSASTRTSTSPTWLGAEVVRLTGARIGDAILDHACRHHVTRIVLGKPTHARILDRLRSSVLDDIVSRQRRHRRARHLRQHRARRRASLGSDGGTSAPRRRLRLSPRSGARGHGHGDRLHSGARPELPDAAIPFFLLAVTLAATRLGRGRSRRPLLSVAAYDFFFIPPRFRWPSRAPGA